MVSGTAMSEGLKAVSRAMLEEAVRLYLEEAYGDAAVPPAARARLLWPAGENLEELAASSAFERMPADVPPEESERLRLRLGNRIYPHMKLGLDRVPDTPDWVLTVDCHDRQLMAVVQENERAAMEALLRRNNEVKTRIERRWTEAGLPTFERYVRGRLARDAREAAGGAGAEPKGTM
jgi:hypothetical protein